MQIAVEIKFEQRRRSVRWPARVGTTGLGKTQFVQIELGDEGVKEAHGVFDGEVIFQALRKEQRLGAVQTSPMIHACQRRRPGVKVSPVNDFSHSLSPEPTDVGAVRSAIAVHVTSRRWLSFFR